MNYDSLSSIMESDISDFVHKIGREAPELVEIWLIGSRANDSASVESDWDFIAMGSTNTLAYLQKSVHLHRADVDFLVVINGDDFEVAWGDRPKSGSLNEWEWTKKSNIDAEYMQSKMLIHADWNECKINKVRAVRVWSL